MKMPIISDVMTDAQSARMGGYADGYNDGVKSMKQEFSELLELANQLRKYPGITADKFDAWKKARGIK